MYLLQLLPIAIAVMLISKLFGFQNVMRKLYGAFIFLYSMGYWIGALLVVLLLTVILILTIREYLDTSVANLSGYEDVLTEDEGGDTHQRIEDLH